MGHIHTLLLTREWIAMLGPQSPAPQSLSTVCERPSPKNYRYPVKRSTSQKGLQVIRSPSQKVYKSKGPQSKGLQKFESLKGIKESCTRTFIIYSFIIIVIILI